MKNSLESITDNKLKFNTFQVSLKKLMEKNYGF